MQKIEEQNKITSFDDQTTHLSLKKLIKMDLCTFRQCCQTESPLYEHLNSFPKQFALENGFTNHFESYFFNCKIHSFPLSFICKTCSAQICCNCAENQHAGHDVELMMLFDQKVQKKARMILRQIDLIKQNLRKNELLQAQILKEQQKIVKIFIEMNKESFNEIGILIRYEVLQVIEKNCLHCRSQKYTKELSRISEQLEYLHAIWYAKFGVMILNEENHYILKILQNDIYKQSIQLKFDKEQLIQKFQSYQDILFKNSFSKYLHLESNITRNCYVVKSHGKLQLIISQSIPEQQEITVLKIEDINIQDVSELKFSITESEKITLDHFLLTIQQVYWICGYITQIHIVVGNVSYLSHVLEKVIELLNEKQSYQQMQIVTLELQTKEISEYNEQPLIEFIKEFPDSFELALKIKYNSGKTGLDLLSKMFKDWLPNIVLSISLDFSFNKMIEESDFQKIQPFIAKLTKQNIKWLEIQMYGCNIGNDVIQKFIASWNKCQILQRLSIKANDQSLSKENTGIELNYSEKKSILWDLDLFKRQ